MSARSIACQIVDCALVIWRRCVLSVMKTLKSNLEALALMFVFLNSLFFFRDFDKTCCDYVIGRYRLPEDVRSGAFVEFAASIMDIGIPARKIDNNDIEFNVRQGEPFVFLRQASHHTFYAIARGRIVRFISLPVMLVDDRQLRLVRCLARLLRAVCRAHCA